MDGVGISEIASIGTKFISRHKLFKYGFNWSPMYRRSTAKIIDVTPDLKSVKIKLPISYKNRNYVNSIFGGSMFSALDPIPMVQLINLLGDQFVVWDKSAEVFFKRPARETLYSEFTCTDEELERIKQRVIQENEIEINKVVQLTDKEQNTVFCEVNKTIYIADKAFYRNKKRDRNKK